MSQGLKQGPQVLTIPGGVASPIVLYDVPTGQSGINLQKTATVAHSTTTGSHRTYTYLDITGKGIFLFIVTNSVSAYYDVQLDNGPIWEWYIENNDGLMWFGLPFNTSLKVTSSTASNTVGSNAMVAIGSGGNLHDYTLSIAKNGTDYANTILSVSGDSGYALGFTLDSSSSYCVNLNNTIRFTVDGSTSKPSSMSFLLPFVSSLRISSSSTIGSAWATQD